MLVAWVGFVFIYFVAFFNALLVFGAFVPPILIFAVLTLLGAGVVATGFRPAPLLGSVVALVTLLVPIIQPHRPAQVLREVAVKRYLAGVSLTSPREVEQGAEHGGLVTGGLERDGTQRRAVVDGDRRV